ncbi:MAG: DUF2232 domain-containing protein [Nitrospirae bacterium]|nr:DUF2232 domain-containing protein [Nitrospirota bacterium]
MPEPNPTESKFGRSAPGMVALAIMAASPFMPLLLAVLPAPLAYARLRYGVGNFAVAASVCAALTLAGGGSVGLFAVVAALVICGNALGVSMSAGEPDDRTLLRGTLIPALSVGAVLAVYFLANGVDPWAIAAKDMDASVSRAVGMYKRLGMSQADIDAALPTVKLWMRVMTDGLVAVAFYTMTATCVMSHALLRRYAVKAGLVKARAEGEGLANWVAPDHAVWGVIIPGFLMIPDVHVLRVAAGNVLAVFALVYLFQGIGIVSYLIGRLKMPRGFRILLWAMVLLQPYLFLTMWAVGLFDTWVDFRKLRKKPDSRDARKA